MTLRAHKQYREIRQWCVGQLPNAIRLNGTYFRVAGPRYTSPAAIVSGAGGYLANSRWCRRRISNVLYVSIAPETAMHESNAWARRNSLPLWSQMPKVTVAIEIQAKRVVDLTDTAIATSLPIPLNDVMEEDWSGENDGGREALSQALGRAAFAGFDGLRVPSKPDPGGVNLVIFRRVSGGPLVRLVDPGSLVSIGKN